MKNLKRVLLTGTITLATMLAMNITANAATVKVTGDVINIRQEASTSSNVVAMLSKDVECEYLGEEGDFYKIKYQRYTGYISKQYSTLVDEGQAPNNSSNNSQEGSDNQNTTPSNQTETQDENQTTNSNENQAVNNTSNNETGNTNEQNNNENNQENTNTQSNETAQLVYKKFNQSTTIRLLPLIYSSEIGNVNKDEEVLILAETSGWSYVQTNQISGWVRTDTLGEAKTVETTDTPDDSKDTQGTTTTTEKTGYVSETSVNVREGAGTSTKIVKTLSLNAKVTITGEENGWYKIKYENIEGYILKDYVSDSEKVTSRSLEEPRTPKENENNSNLNTNNQTAVPENTDTTIEKTAYVSESYVNLREGAGTSTKIVKVLKLNDQITITGEENGWYKVKSGNSTGYILKDYVSDNKKAITTTTNNANTSTNTNTNANTSNTTNNTSNTSSTKGTDIIAYAKTFLGCKYVWGGNGPTSFDCSGFTKYVFNHFGVNLPRTADNQYYYGQGTKITKMSDLKTGDIVFFNDYSSGSPFGHCGIYMGDGNFIHASTTGYTVRISGLSGTYANRFCGGLRVF